MNTTPTNNSAAGSVYTTPSGPTPSGDNIFVYSAMQTSTPLNQHQPPPPNLTPFQSGMPITSPLPTSVLSPAIAMPPSILNTHESVSNDDDALPPEFLRRRDAWIPCASTSRVIDSVRSAAGASFHPDRSQMTMPGIHFRDVLQVWK